MGSKRDRGEKKVLEVLNLMNLISHYEEQLRQIIDGVDASELLSQKEKRKLVKEGIIVQNRTHSPNIEYAVPWAVEALMDRLKE